jgi:ADP-ribosyl-[dinitrogen reductase] hydrolase
MYGAMIGDIAGCVYEFSRNKKYDFQPFMHPEGNYTDDTIMTVAIADALLNDRPPAESMRDWGRRVLPTENGGGYGAGFIKWLAASDLQPPYNSYGNGSAMRVSPAGWLFDEAEDVLSAAKEVTEVSHSHPEGIKGAQAVALAIFMGRKGYERSLIKKTVIDMFGYDLERSIAEARNTHFYNETCPGCVPDALICALSSEAFEEAVRNAISLGGDADTLGAITGSVAEAIFGIPDNMVSEARGRLHKEFIPIVDQFYRKVCATPL